MFTKIKWNCRDSAPLILCAWCSVYDLTTNHSLPLPSLNLNEFFLFLHEILKAHCDPILPLPYLNGFFFGHAFPLFSFPRIKKMCFTELRRQSMAFLIITIDSASNMYAFKYLLYNGNWTEWSAIWSEIISVISKSNERAARVWFEITSMISDQNCTTQSSITTLLHLFWNHRVSLSILTFYFCYFISILMIGYR